MLKYTVFAWSVKLIVIVYVLLYSVFNGLAFSYFVELSIVIKLGVDEEGIRFIVNTEFESISDTSIFHEQLYPA